MIAVTLHEAKAKLNRLVEAARSGKEVVLFRGSQVVATIVPLDPDQLEIISSLTDAQAGRFWGQIKKSKTKRFRNTKAAVAFLKNMNK